MTTFVSLVRLRTAADEHCEKVSALAGMPELVVTSVREPPGGTKPTVPSTRWSVVPESAKLGIGASVERSATTTARALEREVIPTMKAFRRA
jgi:hypothetical protein